MPAGDPIPAGKTLKKREHKLRAWAWKKAYDQQYRIVGSGPVADRVAIETDADAIYAWADNPNLAIVQGRQWAWDVAIDDAQANVAPGDPWPSSSTVASRADQFFNWAIQDANPRVFGEIRQKAYGLALQRLRDFRNHEILSGRVDPGPTSLAQKRDLANEIFEALIKDSR